MSKNFEMDKWIRFKWIHLINCIAILGCQVAILFDFALTFTGYISILLGRTMAVILSLEFCCCVYVEFATFIKTKVAWGVKVVFTLLLIVGALIMFYCVPQLIRGKSDVLI